MRNYIYCCTTCDNMFSQVSIDDSVSENGSSCTKCGGWSKPLKVDKNGHLYVDEY